MIDWYEFLINRKGIQGCIAIIIHVHICMSCYEVHVTRLTDQHYYVHGPILTDQISAAMLVKKYNIRTIQERCAIEFPALSQLNRRFPPSQPIARGASKTNQSPSILIYRNPVCLIFAVPSSRSFENEKRACHGDARGEGRHGRVGDPQARGLPDPGGDPLPSAAEEEEEVSHRRGGAREAAGSAQEWLLPPAGP